MNAFAEVAETSYAQLGQPEVTYFARLSYCQSTQLLSPCTYPQSPLKGSYSCHLPPARNPIMSFVKWKSSGSGGGSGSAATGGLAGHPDFTRNHLRDRETYRLGHLRSLGLQGEVTALAVDPVYGLMAVGTSTGLIHLLGKASFQSMFQLSTLRDQKPIPVKFLTFVPGAGRLCCIDEKNTLHVWNTGPGGIDDTKNQPSKEITTRCVHVSLSIDHR